MPRMQDKHTRNRQEKPEEKAAKINLLSSLTRLLAALIDLIHR